MLWRFMYASLAVPNTYRRMHSHPECSSNKWCFNLTLPIAKSVSSIMSWCVCSGPVNRPILWLLLCKMSPTSKASHQSASLFMVKSCSFLGALYEPMLQVISFTYILWYNRHPKRLLYSSVPIFATSFAFLFFSISKFTTRLTFFLLTNVLSTNIQAFYKYPPQVRFQP